MKPIDLRLLLLFTAACATTETGVVVDVGPSGKADGAAATLPACASPLMHAVFDRAAPKLDGGGVPARFFASARNVAAAAPLVTGPQIFPAMGRLIESARYEVDFSTYVWDNDSDPARELFAAIQRLATAHVPGEPPVTVRLLIDASELGTPSPKLANSMPALARHLDALALDPAAVHVEIAAYEHFGFGNLHSKTVVVDGRAAIITGANPEAVHNYAAPWFDVGYRLDGDVALAVLAQFDDSWRRSHVWTCGAAGGDASACTKSPTSSSHVTDPEALPAACVPMLAVSRNGEGSPFGNHLDNPQDQAFLAILATAQRRVRIVTPNLNDDVAMQAILDAIGRGIDVQLVLSKGFNQTAEQLPGQGGANDESVTALYARLSPHDAACRHLQIRWHSEDGVTAIDGNGPHASHAKYMSADDQLVVVGSANMDTQSWDNAREMNIVVDSAATTQAWDAAVFALDFAHGLQVDDCLAP